jgi:hypothetical protein
MGKHIENETIHRNTLLIIFDFQKPNPKGIKA